MFFILLLASFSNGNKPAFKGFPSTLSSPSTVYFSAGHLDGLATHIESQIMHIIFQLSAVANESTLFHICFSTQKALLIGHDWPDPAKPSLIPVLCNTLTHTWKGGVEQCRKLITDTELSLSPTLYITPTHPRAFAFSGFRHKVMLGLLSENMLRRWITAIWSRAFVCATLVIVFVAN